MHINIFILFQLNFLKKLQKLNIFTNRNMNKIIVFCLVLAIVSVSGRQWFHDVKATSLNPELFDQLVGKDNHYFVEFFTPWCGYCQQMAGEWNKLFSHYEETQETRKDVKIAKINCDDHQRLCIANDVRQYPTVLLYKAGNKRPTHQYQGWRKFEDFRDFIETHAPKPVQENPQEANDDQAKAQQLNEEEQKLKEQEELIRQHEEAIERQHREQLLLLQRQEEEDRLRRQQEERIRLEAEQKLREIEEERIRKLQEEQNRINAQSNQQEQAQNQNQNNQANDSAIMNQINQVLQQTRSIQHQIQQVPQIQSLVHQLKVNLDYTIQKVDIVEQYLKHQKEVAQSLHSEIQKLQAEVKSLKSGSQDKENEGQQQQQQNQQQVKPDQQKKPNKNALPVEKSFNIMHSIIFIAVGVCIGYIFFKFFSRQKSPASLLISHDQLGKSN
ncbi:thioredoxin (macronuclear) [Tetrahymena thermophila SB210]|uniref:Thioredoxin n=1 Tax=Tetrahymena thermophila (strain SB210) TaxID=312017 RepID=Q22XN6_TETTS|nr:thioredoxin [Tetrahymena thermophila SB210]EAR90043.4 thioredoxin [Tetrahymena thermophila SB210]|eukprot:XP_001010288.4 thioredoxin [Tetrahymena thermophila SB210]